MSRNTKNTRMNIYNAFITLRKKKSLEKLTIRELCDTAGINRSTFYAYYHDIYDLSDKIEDDVVSEVLKRLDNMDDILTAPARFTESLSLAYHAQDALISIVFSGTQKQYLPEKIETAIKKAIFSRYPQFKNDAEFNMKLTFSIYGGFFAYNKHFKHEDDNVINIIGNLSEKIIK